MSSITPSPKRLCEFYNLGEIDYMEAWNWQRELVADRRSHPQPQNPEFQLGQGNATTSGQGNAKLGQGNALSLHDVLILLEHPPVYTLGTGASLEFLKFDPTSSNIPVHRIERGGEVTYHCPGQLVGYPILNLRYHCQDLHWYLRQLEEVLIRVLGLYNLEGSRVPGLTGVWVEGRKVAAIGIKVSRWITMHGFALNVNPDLQGFQQIVPCGISDRPVGSLAQFTPDIQMDLVREQVARNFAEVFGLNLFKVDSSLSETRLRS
jgi:lipoyl(octanoyl) transferase